MVTEIKDTKGIFFECDVCRLVYNTLDDAKRCENTPFTDQYPVHRNDYILFAKHIATGAFSYDELYVGRVAHFIRYGHRYLPVVEVKTGDLRGQFIIHLPSNYHFERILTDDECKTFKNHVF